MNKATKLYYWGYGHPRFRRFVLHLLRLVYSCDLSYPRKWGGGNILEHNALGVVISREAAIGSNCRISHHVTIGSGRGGYPTIGDNVVIHTGAVVCGKITIGNNVIIGANSFVNKSFPDDVVIAGCPAKVIKKRDTGTECSETTKSKRH